MSGNTSATGGYLRGTRDIGALYGDQLAQTFQQMAVGITGLDPHLVRPRWQPQAPSQPPVGTDWCALGVTKYERVDYAQVVHNGDDDGSDVQYRLERLEVLATFYGPNAAGVASALRDGIYLRQNSDTLAQSGIKFHSADDIIYIPELINSQYVNRVDLPMSFYRMVPRTYPILNLLSVEVDVFADNGDHCVEVITQES